jgi:hypothetical protein
VRSATLGAGQSQRPAPTSGRGRGGSDVRYNPVALQSATLAIHNPVRHKTHGPPTRSARRFHSGAPGLTSGRHRRHAR